jgi:hypothetical protein
MSPNNLDTSRRIDVQSMRQRGRHNDWPELLAPVGKHHDGECSSDRAVGLSALTKSLDESPHKGMIPNRKFAKGRHYPKSIFRNDKNTPHCDS